MEYDLLGDIEFLLVEFVVFCFVGSVWSVEFVFGDV